MKKYILSLIFISTATFAQDYSKLKNSQLVDTINKKNEIIKKLNSPVSQYKKKQDELLNKNDNFKVVENFKSIIKDDNKYWLKDLFEKKYTDTYFAETDLDIEDISLKIEKSNVYINSIKSVETNVEIIDKCNQALDFNSNYQILYSIKNTVLDEKYNEKNVKEAISNIEKLPKLRADSKLEATKNRFRNYLENYLERTCELKKILEQLKKNPDQTPVFKQQYTKLENKEDYKVYPFLIQIIRKIKNNRNDYSNDDLQPCIEIKEKKPEAVKPEAVKESTPVKVEELQEDKK